MKTLNVTAIAQLQNQEHGGCVSDIRKTNATRINLAFCQPDKAFSHNQNPTQTFGIPTFDRQIGQQADGIAIQCPEPESPSTANFATVFGQFEV